MKAHSHKQKTLALLVLVVVITASQSAEAKLRKWNQKMQELGKTFSELLPELADSKPITTKTHKQLEKSAKKLLDLAHTINMGPGTSGNPLPPEADPTIGFVSNLFEREVKHAYHALQAGHTAYARSVLRTVSGYCIACHTRHDRGPDFPSIDLSPNTQSLTRMQKAELLAATRQFDAALEEFEAIAGDASFAKTNQIEWGRAIRHGFTLAVRVKKDPDRANNLIDRVLSLPQLPGFYAGNIPAWKKSIMEWKAEPPTKTNTEEGLFMEAVRLNKTAKEMQEWPLDHSADVLYLRSSLVAHELLTQYPGGKRTAEAMLLAGTAYDLLEDRLISPLPDMYYEACIRHSPHTPIAERCYERYETNIFFGYSGSAGTFVPDELKALMKELRALAQVKPK